MRVEHHTLAQAALRDMVSLLEYLQSPKATANVQKVRAQRQARRTQNPEHRTQN